MLQVRQLAQPAPASALPADAPADEPAAAPLVEGQMAVVPAAARPRP